MADLKKLFVWVPSGITRNEIIEKSLENEKKIYFHLGTQTIFNKGVEYGMNPETLEELEDKIQANADAITALTEDLAVVSENLADEIARAIAAESGLSNAIVAEQERAEGVEEDLQKQIDELVSGSTVVKEGDKILSLDGNELSSTLDMVYDSSAKTITLVGIDGAEIAQIDATDFVKDGFLTKVDYYPTEAEAETGFEDLAPYIKFTWNVDASSGATENVTRVSVKNLVDTYVVKEGSEDFIEITGYTVEIKTSDIEKDATGLAKASDVYDAIDNANSALTAAIEAEKERAEGVEKDLDDLIDAVNTALTAEINAREVADADLQEQIDALTSGSSKALDEEIERATKAEEDLQSGLTAEIERAKDAEADLQEQIDALATGLTEAIEALDAEVTSEDNDYIEVKVTEENGKITAVNVDFDPWETYGE